MQQLFSIFPERWPGVGLIFLRLVVCSSVVAQGFHLFVSAQAGEFGKGIIGVISILLALFVLIGFFTPITSMAVTLSFGAIGIWMLFSPETTRHMSGIGTLNSSLASTALALLGPGAYSIDARLFGRREIIIPESRRQTE